MFLAKFAGLLALVSAGLALAQSADPRAVHSPDGKPLSQRVVAYTIDAKLDVAAKTLDASEVLVYRNLTGQPLDTFPFHLYLNAFQPQSTWMREAHEQGSRDWGEGKGWDNKYYGAIDIRKLAVDGMGDLTSQLHFIAPDDRNKEDKTVTELKLPRAIAPGESVTFRIDFHDKFPEAVARNGYKYDFFMGGQWFPKVGVFWHGAWNCHQYHATTEFFSDFGTYDVRLTLPKNYTVGASGVQEGGSENADGTRTWIFHGEDIHDFAWAASPHFHVFDRTFQSSLGPVKMHALVLPSHVGQGERYLDILQQTMERFDQWYGPYPYTQITLIDPAAGPMAGMEYPTLFTAGTFWGAPEGFHFPELVTEHEFGHEYWYGMVATNEFEEAWLDEGINSYSEGKVLDSIYGPERSVFDLRSVHMGETGLMESEYSTVADTDPLSRHAWQFMDGNTYGGITYAKTALFLRTLEGLVGEETVQKGLRTYFERYRFQHPTGEDFLKTMEEVAGRDLRPYFSQAVYGTPVLDYEVRSVESEPMQWWKNEKPGKDTVYRSYVLVHRKGDFILPVKVAVRFSDGQVVNENWDGQDRWIRYTYDRPAKVVSATVDPLGQMVLDNNFINNSRTAEAHTRAAHKLANFWLVLSQWFGQMLSWLV